jgi:hypothetical protein
MEKLLQYFSVFPLPNRLVVLVLDFWAMLVMSGDRQNG